MCSKCVADYMLKSDKTCVRILNDCKIFNPED